MIHYEIFEEVFIGVEKLEQVAPFAVNQNINLAKCAAALFDTLNFDDILKLLNYALPAVRWYQMFLSSL